MPDNSAAIARIQAILQAGADQVVVDGQTIHYDFRVLRQQLRQLMLTDTSNGGANALRRPVCGQINLGNF